MEQAQQILTKLLKKFNNMKFELSRLTTASFQVPHHYDQTFPPPCLTTNKYNIDIKIFTNKNLNGRILSLLQQIKPGIKTYYIYEIFMFNKQEWSLTLTATLVVKICKLF